MPEKYRCVVSTGMCSNVQHALRNFSMTEALIEQADCFTLMGMQSGKENNMNGKRVVLCGANAYDKKYYFNQDFDKIPDSIKDELHIICVLFTEEVGGIFTLVFEEDGSLSMETDAEDDDIYYDEISSGLLISEIRRNRQELLESLSLYYRVFILKEDPALILEENE